MENLTHYQLVSCEAVLRQIEEEHRKHEALSKENEILNSKLSAISISTKKERIKDNVFKCLVKVFNSSFAVYDLLSEKISPYELETAIRCKNKKYYFVEIYVANSFQARIIHQNWLINAYLSNSRDQISKSINLKSKISNPLCMLMPFDDSNEEAVLKISVAWPEGQSWPYLQLIDIPIDISYHFDVASTLKSRSINSKILRICKLYDVDMRYVSGNKICQSRLNCTLDADLFLEIVLKNSYHTLDLKNQATFSRINDILTIKLSVGNEEEAVIKLDTKNRTLSIAANFRDLYLLKKYFIQKSCLHIKLLEADPLRSLQQLKSALMDTTNYTVIYDVYSKLRRIII